MGSYVGLQGSGDHVELCRYPGYSLGPSLGLRVVRSGVGNGISAAVT